MFRTLVKTDALAVDDQTLPVRYFELRTLRGARRYSAEILLGPGDRIILDDDSVTNLEAQDDVAGAGDALQPAAGAARPRRPETTASGAATTAAAALLSTRTSAVAAGVRRTAPTSAAEPRLSAASRSAPSRRSSRES